MHRSIEEPTHKHWNNGLDAKYPRPQVDGFEAQCDQSLYFVIDQSALGSDED